MAGKRRVFITGYGSVTRLHSGSELVKQLCERSIAAADAELPFTYPIGEVDADLYGNGKFTRRMDRFALLAHLAVKHALCHADVNLEKLDRERAGVVMNTCYGPLDSTRRYITKLIREGARKVPAAVFPNTVHNAFTGLITIDLSVHGTNSTVSGYNPILYGVDMIRGGSDDLMIVGGCDELLNAIEIAFSAVGLLDARRTTAIRGMGGFASDVNSLVLGEGAAALVLEGEECVEARGGKALAEIVDYGMANSLSDTFGAAFPADARAVEFAMVQALRRGEVDAGDIGLVCASCNGLPTLARAETQAIDRVFGSSDRPLISNAKSALGETLGAAAALSTMVAVDALSQGVAPPIWGLAPSNLPRRYVAGSPAPVTSALALVNSVELGGGTTSLLVKRWAAN